MRPWLSMAPLPPRSPAGRVKLLMVFQNLAPILIGNLPGVLYTSPGDDLIAGWCRISDASQPNVVKNVFFFSGDKSMSKLWEQCSGQMGDLPEINLWSQCLTVQQSKQVEVRHSAGTAGLLLAQFTSSIGTGWSFLICIQVYNLWYVNIYWGMPKPCNSW